MQDVIIESSNQSSSLAANVRKVTIKKSRGIFSYMFDWLIKGLLTALLLIMNFLLFAGSGSQKVFADGFMLQPEIMSVVIGLLVFHAADALVFFFFRFAESAGFADCRRLCVGVAQSVCRL